MKGQCVIIRKDDAEGVDAADSRARSWDATGRSGAETKGSDMAMVLEYIGCWDVTYWLTCFLQVAPSTSIGHPQSRRCWSACRRRSPV